MKVILTILFFLTLLNSNGQSSGYVLTRPDGTPMLKAGALDDSLLKSAKQNQLISGTNIKTINGSTVLGSGDLVVSGAPVFYYGSDAGNNDSYAVTISGITSYTPGMIITFRANTANTTGCTLNVNGLGAIAIVKRNNTTPASNDIIAGMICMVVYNGNNQFTIVNPIVN